MPGDLTVTEPAAPRSAPSLAVVGLACRFPDAADAPELLDVVLTGRRSFRRIPRVRLDVADYYRRNPATADATYSTRAALIEGWEFDRAAFGIDQVAFVAADPALWLALETAARALAGAGLTGGTGLNRDRTGVIIGSTLGGDVSRANALRVRWPYVRQVLTDALTTHVPETQASAVLASAERRYLTPFPPMGPRSLAGASPGAIAAAISGYFGFRGGSQAVDSACSSSLQAVASACTALASGELDAVVAGGVEISIDPLRLIGLAKAGVLTDGEVWIYDENPTGCLPAEGCGVVVLMRTADARSAGLPVYAEIAGWGTSAGGAPGDEPKSSSQLLAMQRAYDRAGTEPGDIQLLEGNGASTRDDDDAELAALGVLRRGARQTAVLGSVKANIGHAQAAAGAAGLIKTVLAMSTGVLPPTTGVRRPHPMITEGDARLTLPATAADWPEGVRLAAVSTLNSGGANVHLVLRAEPPARTRHDRWARSRVVPARSLDGDGVTPRLMAPPSQPLPYLLTAPNRFALAAVLNRLAAIAGWLTDAELQDLACGLGREEGSQGKARVALVAAGQEQLAARAAEAAALLPHLTEGLLAVQPGIFAADDGDGRVTLLLSGEAGADGSDPVTGSVGHCLGTLQWLESLDVSASAAVGHGVGALAGLAWAGVLGQGDVVDIAQLRAQFLNQAAPPPQTSADGTAAGSPPAASRVGAAALRAAIAQKFRFGPPRRRLLSTLTGTEIASVDDAIDLICSGFAGTDHMIDAIKGGALGASLLLETGPGTEMTTAAATATRVPAVSLESGPEDPAGSAHAAAALFAAGALGQPQAFFGGWPARPIDIWRERTFIAGPCETRPQGAPAEQKQPADVSQAERPRGLAEVRDEFERRPPATPSAAPVAQASPIPGLAPWARCFAEELRPVPVPDAPEPAAGWRLHMAGSSSRLAAVTGAFKSEATAGQALAVIGDPADDDSRAAALQAARDGIETGRLVVVTWSQGFTGFFASLQAEHPAMGVTILRVPDSDEGVALARKFASAEPGQFRELALAAGGTAAEPVMAPLESRRGGPFPLGPDDVVVVSRDARGAGLALAQVLACCGTPVAVIGRPSGEDDSELVAGLEKLRSAGARVGYEVIDLTSQSSLAAAIARIEDRLGRVTAIGHSAGPGGSHVPFIEVSDIEISGHVASETATLEHIVGAIRPGQLRMIITFGSVAGRYGLAGASQLALSGGALAGRAAQLAGAIRGCASLHVDVPAWSDAGLGERQDLADDLAAAGTSAIDVSTASRLLLKAMTTPDRPGRIAIHGRVSGPAATSSAGLSPAQLAAAGLPDGGRFLREVRVNYPGVELVCAPRLSVETDPYLADYRVDGLAVLPGVLAVEALAEAASVLAGRPVRLASNVRLESPVVVPAQGTAELRICAQREGTVIRAALRCADSSFAVDHARAEFSCATAEDARPAAVLSAALPAAGALPLALSAGPSGLVDGTEFYGPIAFQAGRFRRVALLPEVTARSCRALARGSDDQPWFDAGSPLAGSGFLLGSPGVADVSLHVLQACVPHRRLWPAGSASVWSSGRAAEGAVEIRAVATSAGGAPALSVPAQARPGIQASVPAQAGVPAAERAPADHLVPVQARADQLADERWDIEAVDSAGELLFAWRGVQVRDAGPLPRNAAWPPSLLSVYLERSCCDLGLDPALRATVSCGQPQESGPRGSGPQGPGPQGPVPQGSAARSSEPRGSRPPQGSRPQRSASRAKAPSPAGPAASHTAEAVGTGPLAGFSLAVSAPVPVACGWHLVESGHRQPLPPPGMAAAYTQLRAQLAESPGELAARLRAASACLEMARLTIAEPMSCRKVSGDGWALLTVGPASIATAVVEISGVASQVAIAIMTTAVTTPAPVRAAAPAAARAPRRGGVRAAARP